jgi:hypothetical protein
MQNVAKKEDPRVGGQHLGRCRRRTISSPRERRTWNAPSSAAPILRRDHPVQWVEDAVLWCSITPARTSTRRMISRPQRGVDSGMATQVLPQQTVVYIRFSETSGSGETSRCKTASVFSSACFSWSQTSSKLYPKTIKEEHTWLSNSTAGWTRSPFSKNSSKGARMGQEMFVFDGYLWLKTACPRRKKRWE